MARVRLRPFVRALKSRESPSLSAWRLLPTWFFSLSWLRSTALGHRGWLTDARMWYRPWHTINCWRCYAGFIFPFVDVCMFCVCVSARTNVALSLTLAATAPTAMRGGFKFQHISSLAERWPQQKRFQNLELVIYSSAQHFFFSSLFFTSNPNTWERSQIHFHRP